MPLDNTAVCKKVPASGAAVTLWMDQAMYFDVTLTAACVLDIQGASSGDGIELTLVLRQDAVGGRTVTWPASVKWAGGTPPVLTAGANAIDVIDLVTVDGGVTWFGLAKSQALA